jgi:hypothetical protein
LGGNRFTGFEAIGVAPGGGGGNFGAAYFMVLAACAAAPGGGGGNFGVDCFAVFAFCAAAGGGGGGNFGVAAASFDRPDGAASSGRPAADIGSSSVELEPCTGSVTELAT